MLNSANNEILTRVGPGTAMGPDGQVKFPHPWPPQIPPGRTVGL